MSRRWPTLLTAILSAAPAFADEPKELKVLASAKETTREYSIGPVAFQKAGMVAIRSAEELVAASDKPKKAKDPAVQKEMEQALAKLLKVEAIDWSKQMVVAVNIAEVIDSVKTDGRVVTVTFTRHIERPSRAVLPLPKVAVLVERADGEVKFVPKDPPKKDPKE